MGPGLSGDFTGGEGLADWPLHRELALLAAGRLCGPAQRRRCQAENGAFAPWACGVCEEYVRPEAVSPWTWHLVFLHQLRQAGYPFGANDLTLEEWLLLGLVQQLLAGRQGHHAQKEL